MIIIIIHTARIPSEGKADAAWMGDPDSVFKSPPPWVHASGDVARTR